MNKLKGLYTILFIIFLSPLGMTQDAIIKLIWQEEEEAFFSGNLHRVKCEFTTNTDHKVKLKVKPELPLKLLSPSSFKIAAKKDEASASSCKIYLPQTGAGEKDSLCFEIILESMENKSILGKEKLCLEIKERIVIRMETVRAQIPIDAADTLAQIPLRVKNMGRRKYQVEVALQNKPEGLKMLESEKVFMLKAKQDTVVKFNMRPEKTWQKTHSAFLKYVLFLKKNDEKLAKCNVSAFPMGHIKKYHHPNYAINNLHEFRVGFQSRGPNQNVIDFSTNGKTPLHKGVLNYQLQSIYYSDMAEVNLTNSVLNYIANGKSLTVGHVSYNDEASLSGRGVLYEIEKDSQYVHFGFINGAYKLFDPTTAFNTLTGNSVVGGIRKIHNRLGLIEGNGMIRLRESSNTGLVWLNNRISKNKNQFNFRVGVSGDQDKVHPTDNSFKTGVILSADFEKETNNWVFQTSNYFSTPRYAGNVPGSFFSRNKFDYLAWKPLNIKALVRFQKTQSFVRKENYVLSRLGDVMNYQLQFETKRTGNWRIVITPSQLFTKSNFIDQNLPENFYTSSTSRIKLAITRKKNGVTAQWDGDVGTFHYGKKGAMQKQFLFYRLGLKLSTKTFGFNASYNRGSTLLSNAMRYEQFGTYFSNFQFGARWGKWFFKRKIKANLSNQLTHNGIRKQWANSTAFKIKSILPKGFSVDTEFALFKTANFNDFFWNIKVVKKIGNYRPPSGAKKLKLILYEDANNSSTKDDTEQGLEGIFVQVGGIPFVTKNGGWIQYKSVPTGEYDVSVMDPTGELAGSAQKIKLDKKNVEIHIPLYKTVPLGGVVKEIKVRFKSSKFDLLGIPIIAKNPQEEVFTTFTQPDGSFRFNLPANEYTIYIDPEAFGKNFEFPDNFQKVVLTQNEQTDLSLSVKVKSRKMKIQKF